MDVLSDILRTIHLKGSVYFNSCFCSPWGVDVARDNNAAFHIVVRGQCWLHTGSLPEPQPLVGGDIVVLPQGSAHQISDRPGGPCHSGAEVVERIINGDNPFSGAQDNFQIICGHFEFSRDIPHPFLTALPEVIQLSQEDRKDVDWLNNILNLIIGETGSQQPGGSALIDRYTEILFIQVIRAYMSLTSQDNNYLAALNDRQISRALTAIHRNHQSHWTIESLAKEAGMSRSVFANRFHTLVGVPPMRYLTSWRMQLARQRIESTKLPLTEVAEQVGYSSDSAFKKAFKNFFGKTPASFRKKTDRNG